MLPTTPAELDGNGYSPELGRERYAGP